MINSGDTAFMIICTALVFFMTPGLAFFYGGLVRRKNVISTMMNCVAIMGISILLWFAFGYTLSFGSDHYGIIGDFSKVFLNNVDWETGTYSDSIPELLFCAFQMMFAMIAPALFTGSLVGRVRFKALMIFVIAWSCLVYYPLVHMIWGQGGLLAKMGAIDFAGGYAVHIASGISALVLAILLGKRYGYDHSSLYKTHNIPFVALGAFMLWFGWFGFNAGSSLKADGLAVHAFMTSAISAAVGLVAWMFMDYKKTGKTTLVGASTGLVVGLASVTQASGFIPFWAAFVIGGVASPLCYTAVSLIKEKLKIDDTLDAFGCHGIGGIWGCIATGLFAKSSINPVAQWDGLVYREVHLFGVEMLAMLITMAVAVIGTIVIYKLISLFLPFRVEDKEELLGMDMTQHGENAYPSFNGMDS